MSNPPSAMGPPSVAAVARTNMVAAAHSAGPLGQSHTQTQTQGLKRAFEGMFCSSVTSFIIFHQQRVNIHVGICPNCYHVVCVLICTDDGIMIIVLAKSSQPRSPT
jgi:hypothetical protein